MTKFLRFFGFRFLLPWLEVSEEPLDDRGSPCVFTGRPPAKYKGTYFGVAWLGLVIGICRNIRRLEESDYDGYLVNKLCPVCSSQLYANKLGMLWCTCCNHKEELFTSTD